MRQDGTSKKLKCRVLSVEISGGGQHVAFMLAEGHCSDMDGAIEVAEALSNNVSTIRTYSGTKPDTMYLKESGDWHAYDSEGERP